MRYNSLLLSIINLLHYIIMVIFFIKFKKEVFMKKKLISILFLTAILFVSCSNENKTGPSSNNNNDLKYSGSWTFTNTPNYKGGVLTIN